MKRAPLLAGAVVLAAVTLADAPHPIPVAPALRLRRTLGVDGACPGADRVRVLAATSVTYCYTVTNTASTPARDVVITDARGSVPVGTLAGGQSRTVTRTVVMTADAGSLAVASAVESATTMPGVGVAEAACTDAVIPALSSTAALSSEACRGVEVPDVTSSDATASPAPRLALSAAPTATLQSP